MGDHDTHLAAAIQAEMHRQGVSQAELARRLNPDSPNARQALNQYLAGRRGLLTGMMTRILDALGLEISVRPKQ